MKAAYPIIMAESKDYITVWIPDFNINTQGTTYAESIEMARDAIGLTGIDMEDDGIVLPLPTPIGLIQPASSGITTLVDIDFDEYRRRHDMRTVRRNVSLPCWLDAAAERAGINVSAVLQQALKQKLNLTDK